jgi:hypothetical protein
MSVLPITLVVSLIHLFLSPLDATVWIRFLIGAGFIIFGLTVFLFGIDIGITPIGQQFGSKLAKINKIGLVIVITFLLGFLISIAEPDLQILAKQVQNITGNALSASELVLAVSIGLGLLVMIGVIRILFDISLKMAFFIIYLIIFIITIFTNPGMLAIAFDSSGATTGALTVPFVLAVTIGVSGIKKNTKNAENDSFGLVGLASSGAILGVLILNIITKPETSFGEFTIEYTQSSLWYPFGYYLLPTVGDVLIALSPIVLLLFISQIFLFRLRARQFGNIIKGIFYVFIGLVLFLVGAHAGFMEAGAILGQQLAENYTPLVIYIIAFLFGMVIILAEPAVYVLTYQIEAVTNAYIKRRIVIITLALGMGCAILLHTMRIFIPNFQLWHILLPGYIIVMILLPFVPRLFVGIAFDSGGVASGPMCATFMLAFTQGLASSDNILALEDAFGMIALVALIPIIAIQLLGLIYYIKTKKEVVHGTV